MEVEGEEYRRCKSMESFGLCSFDAFLQEYESLTKRIPDELRLKNRDLHITVDGNAAIYGLDGYNRYGVNWDGELVFIEQLAAFPQKETIKKAKQAGFRTKY